MGAPTQPRVRSVSMMPARARAARQVPLREARGGSERRGRAVDDDVRDVHALRAKLARERLTCRQASTRSGPREEEEEESRERAGRTEEPQRALARRERRELGRALDRSGRSCDTDAARESVEARREAEEEEGRTRDAVEAAARREQERQDGLREAEGAVPARRSVSSGLAEERRRNEEGHTDSTRRWGAGRPPGARGTVQG